VLGLDHADVGLHAVGLAFLVAGHRGIAVNPGARGQCRIGETERVVERMQMRGAHIEVTAMVTVAANQLSHAVLFEEFDLAVVVFPLQEVDVFPAFPYVLGLVQGVGDTRFQVAIDAVLRNQLPDGILGGLGEFPEAARGIGADHFAESDLILALAAANLAAIAAGGAPSGLAGLEQRCSALDRPV
jgi:hypothetical protein